ncbi:MAG: carboxyltransferase domain-containing protein [Oscillospiraceae bacterium]
MGIAGKQTGIYSIDDSPGGWQLIGRTPIRLYDPDRQPPILHQTGDYIRFIPITREEYDSIEKAVRQGTYEYRPGSQKGGG